MPLSYIPEEEYRAAAQAPLPEQDPRFGSVVDGLYADFQKQQQNFSGDAGGYTQVDLRPDWYKRFLEKNKYDTKGPPTTSTMADVAGGALSAGQAGAQQNANLIAQMPGARAGDIMKMQGKANALGLMSGALGPLLTKKSRDFDTQQKRAIADASELRKNQKTGFSANEKLGLANLMRGTVRDDRNWRKHVDETGKAIAEADPNSPESRDTQIAGVKSGMVGPETAADMSKEQLKTWRTGLMQAQGQEHKDEYYDRTHDREEAERIGTEERAEMRRVEQERREEALRRQQSQVPGYAWANDTPPPAATVVLARDLATSREEMMKSAERLAQIQAKLEELRGLAAAVGQNVDAYIGPQYSKDLLAEAKLAQSKMTTAARKLDAMGVPQQFELEIQNSLNPVAGTVGAYFRGAAPWNAIRDYYDKTGRNQLNKLGLFEEGDEKRPVGNDIISKPAAEQITRVPRPEVRRKTPAPAASQAAPGQAAALQDEYGVQPGDSLGGPQPVPPIPADARKPAASPSPVAGPQGDKPMEGSWVVEVNGQRSKPRQLTESQYKMLQQKYGPGAVKRAQ